MKTLIVLFTLITTLSAEALTSGEVAPDFKLTGTTTKGKEISLSDFKGKIVVLEWMNEGCPFVRKHYESGNMQALQKKFTEKNVIWLTIVSSAPGKQGHFDHEGAVKNRMAQKASPTDVLLDPSGKVGTLYEAKTTPHMYVIDKNGILAYQGAIDDKPDTDRDSIASAKNYVVNALDEIMAGKKVSQPATKAYGCSVKY